MIGFFGPGNEESVQIFEEEQERESEEFLRVFNASN